MSASNKVIIIGAGVIGTSISMNLQEAGASVTVIDEGKIGGLASRNSFGWINATYGNPKPYFDLRCASMKAWKDLKEQHPKLPYRNNGTLYVDFERVDLTTFEEEHVAWGYALKKTARDAAGKREPFVRHISSECLIAPEEAAVEVDKAANFFASRAIELGAQIFENERVNRLLVEDDAASKIQTISRELEADMIVLAAGLGTETLGATAGLDLPMDSPPGLLVTTTPCPPLLQHTIITDGLHILQKSDGSLLAGGDFSGAYLTEDPQAGAEELIRRIKYHIRGTENLELDKYTLGYRPTPKDGFPVVGFSTQVSNLYVATMHSGATLAPIIGQLAREEIMNGQPADLLSEFRQGGLVSGERR